MAVTLWSCINMHAPPFRQPLPWPPVFLPIFSLVLIVAGVNVLELGGEQERAAGFVGTDPLRLTISFDGGIGGYEADELLIDGKH